MSKKKKKKPILKSTLALKVASGGVKKKKSTTAKKTPYQPGLFARADTRQVLHLKKGKKRPLKTSVMIDADRLEADSPMLDRAIFDAQYAVEVNRAATYRPVKTVTKLSKNDSPLKVMTPNKTVLKRVSRIGPISCFSNDPDRVRVDLFNVKKPTKAYLKSALREKLVDVSGTTKAQETTVSQKSLKKIAKRNKKHKGKRSVTQNRFMAKAEFNKKYGSATLHAQEAGLADSSECYEHSHLVAHSLMPKEKKAQRPENIVMASSSSNTEVIAIEQATRELCQENKHRFAYKVRATHTAHFGLTEEYEIQSGKFKMVMDLNPQTKNKPHQDHVYYIKHAIKQTHDVVRKAPKQAVSTTQAVSASQGTLFSKPDLKADLQAQKHKKKTSKLKKTA